VTRKPRVVTFRMDQATWDRMKGVVPYTRYGNTSSFIREGVYLMLNREYEQPSGWTRGPAAKGVTDPVPGRPGQTSPSGLWRPSARRDDRREG
jgi:hypothetical protein